MTFIYVAILILIAALWGAKIAIETPEEMHLRRFIFNIVRAINFIIVLILLITSEDLFLFVIGFFFYVITYFQEELLKETIVKHKKTVFYKLFTYGNFLFIIASLMFYFYFKNLIVYFIFAILTIIHVILLTVLEGYYEIKLKHPKKRFTTETRFEFSFTSWLYLKTVLRYLPLSLAFIILDLLLRIKL